MTRPALVSQLSTRRFFSSASPRLNVLGKSPVVIQRKRKIGAVRGGFVGFCVGALVAGGFTLSYLLNEYRAANTVIVGQVVALNGSVAKLEAHVKELEGKIKD